MRVAVVDQRGCHRGRHGGGAGGIPAGTPLGELRLRARDLSPALAVEADTLGLGTDPGPAETQHTPGGAVAGGLDAEVARLEARIRALPDSRRQGLAAALEAARRGDVPGPAKVEPQAGAALPAPVTDPDELVQLLAMLMEEARDPIAAERAFAGAVRLSALPLQMRRRAAAPLLKRAAAVMNDDDPFAGDRITSDMALIAHGWGGGQVPAITKRRKDRSAWYLPGTVAVDSAGQALTVSGIFSARAWEAARLIAAGHGGQLLAEPETDRAAISPARLLERLLAARKDKRGLAGRHDRTLRYCGWRAEPTTRSGKTGAHSTGLPPPSCRPATASSRPSSGLRPSPAPLRAGRPADTATGTRCCSPRSPATCRPFPGARPGGC